MQALSDAQAPPSKPELLAALKDSVSKIVREDVANDIEPERVWQLRQAQKNDFYWRALQFLAPQMTDAGIASFAALGSPLASATDRTGENNGAGMYDYVQNIYRGYGRKFIAVLGQRMPNVKAVPDDPEDEESLKVTRMADVAASILRSKWDAELRSLELCMHLWKNSTTFAYTPWVTDGLKYGTNQQPKVEMRQVQVGPPSYRCMQCGADTPDAGAPVTACPKCGSSMLEQRSPEMMQVPEQVGVETYDNGSVEFHLCNIFTISCPTFGKDEKDIPWLAYEYDEYRGKLKKLYPQLRKKLPQDSGGGTESASTSVGTTVRDASASPLGVPNPHRSSRWNYRRIWLKPDMFENVDDEAKYKLLKENFPTGLKVTLVENEVIDLEHEKLTDVWAMCKPETSEYIFADPIGQDMISIQDLRNDTLNIAAQTLEGGLGFNFVDPRVIDVDWWNSHRAQPNAIIPVVGAMGAQLSDAFYQTQPARFSDQMMPWIQGEEAAARTIVGTTEAVYGGLVPGDQTAHGAELAKNAALQQLSLTFVYIRKFWEKAYTNGVKQLSRYGQGMLRQTRKGENGYESMLLELAQLKEDGWHFEAEESFPMTHAEQRAYLIWMLSNQQIAESQGFSDPRNVRRTHELLGFTGYKAPGVDSHDKATEIIGDLIKAAPIQKPQPDGSIADEPSIPADDFDNHTEMAKEAYSWCVSSLGRRVRKENEAGFNNVVAWGKAHFVAANPPAPPTPAPSPKLSISTKLNELPPENQQAILGDFNLLPDSPPVNPGKEGSAPKPVGVGSQPRPIAPSGLVGAPPMMQ